MNATQLTSTKAERRGATPHLELGTADLARLAMLTNYGSSLMLIPENYTNGNLPKSVRSASNCTFFTETRRLA